MCQCKSNISVIFSFFTINAIFITSKYDQNMFMVNVNSYNIHWMLVLGDWVTLWNKSNQFNF